MSYVLLIISYLKPLLKEVKLVVTVHLNTSVEKSLDVLAGPRRIIMQSFLCSLQVYNQAYDTLCIL